MCPLTVYVDTDAGDVINYYIHIESFFTAEENPYAYTDQRRLVSDAFAFCRAVPYVLRRVECDRSVLLHANDWETALVAYTSKLAIIEGTLDSAKTVLTLHNAFDAGLPSETARMFIGRDLPGHRPHRHSFQPRSTRPHSRCG